MLQLLIQSMDRRYYLPALHAYLFMAMLRKNRTLIAVALAHATQDGLIAMQFVLMPLLASSLGLNYAQVGLLKAIGSSAVALLEIPSALLAEKFGERILLFSGLAAAALGYAAVSMSNTFFWVAAGFLVAGCGAAFQHSLSSSLVVKHYRGSQRRRSLGLYNSAGDLGKLSFAAFFGLLIGAGFAWSKVVLILAGAALLFGAIVYWLLLPATSFQADQQNSIAANNTGWGIKLRVRFALIATVTFLDGVVQAVFLTFIAFVLLHKGSSPALASFAVVFTLAGGLIGKFIGGYLAASFGDRVSFQLIQLLTVIGLIAVIILPATALMFILPLVGLAVQGSSTVYYGATADCAQEGRQPRVYGLVYTFANSASVIGPFALGPVADRFGLTTLLWVLVATTTITMLLGLGFTGMAHENR